MDPIGFFTSLTWTIVGKYILLFVILYVADKFTFELFLYTGTRKGAKFANTLDCFLSILQVFILVFSGHPAIASMLMGMTARQFLDKKSLAYRISIINKYRLFLNAMARARDNPSNKP